MNIRILATAGLAALLPLAAGAQSPTAETAPVEATPLWLDVACARPELPKQQDFARLAGIDNFGQAYALRSRTMVNVQHHCQAGAQTVRLVMQADAPLDRRVAVVVRQAR